MDPDKEDVEEKAFIKEFTKTLIHIEEEAQQAISSARLKGQIFEGSVGRVLNSAQYNTIIKFC